MDCSQDGKSKMINIKLIKKENISLWLDEIIKKYKVIAPQKIDQNDFMFKQLESAKEVALDYINPVISPVKEILFPSKEVILKYKKKDNSWETEVKEPGEKTVLFGIRSCDLSAMLFMDRFFLEGFKDSYYGSKRDNLITVVITCIDPAESCFCVCADAGPSKNTGFDLQLTKLDGNYLVEIGSAKGEELVKIASSFFTDAVEKELKTKEKIIEKVKEKFKLPTTYFSRAIRKVTAGVDEALWEKLSSRCLTCGSCSFVCPTCTCFNVVDEATSADEGQRMRTWDSCMYAGFAREVSGHNPRKLRKERVKRRYYHKLSYYYLTKMGTHGCVGCGRCVVSCLGGIDMSMVSKAVRREK